MKKSCCFILAIICFFPLLVQAGSLHKIFLDTPPKVPIGYTLDKQPAVFYLPSACSGLINDAVGSEGNLSVVVQGQIQNGQLSVLVKVVFKGEALTTIGNLRYAIDGMISASETRTISTEPVDVFLKGTLVLKCKEKSPDLYLGDIGYITVYPDGSVISHIFHPGNNPEYSHAKIYCRPPAL